MGSRYIPVLIVVVLAACYGQIARRIEMGKFVKSSAVVTSSARVRSTLECATSCSRHPGCWLFNHNTEDLRCHLLQASWRDHAVFNHKLWRHGRIKAMKTCQAWRESGKSASGYYMIDPDGDSKGVEPFLVHCDMADPTGLAATWIAHNSEKRTLVDGYEDNGSYRRKIRYNATNAQVRALLDVSSHCKQFLSRECYASYMKYYGVWANWWVSRDGVKMTYWGGAAPGSGKCACGMSGTCVSSTLECNCDKNAAEWLSDEGFLTDKKTLPISQINFGDTGNDKLVPSIDEKAYHTVGKLICYHQK